MAQTTVLLADGELVACGWIRSIPGFTADVVATTLPADESQWIDNGAIQVTVISGTLNPDVAFHTTLVQADCYANNEGSNKPPWGKSLSLATQIYLGCLGRRTVPRAVTVSKGGLTYPPATVRTAYAPMEPRRLPGDPGDYAIYSIDLALTWSQVGQITP